MTREVWGARHWLYFSDPCRTHLIWSLNCAPETGCVALHDGFSLHVEPDGALRFTRDLPAKTRVSYLLDGMIADVPELFSAPVDPLLESYLIEGGHILIEWQDEKVETLSLEGLAVISSRLRDLTGRIPHFDEPTIMLRYESLHDPVGDDPYVFLPATKPQIQFAIRAQDAVPFGPANRNSTPVSEER
ncbi:MAG: hypothetical protein ACWA47_00905 [Brevirhabdus sp.]